MHIGSTFDLVFEDRLPSCVAHTSAFEYNSVVNGDGGAKGVMQRGKEDTGRESDIVMQYCEDVPRGLRDRFSCSYVRLCSFYFLLFFFFINKYSSVVEWIEIELHLKNVAWQKDSKEEHEWRDNVDYKRIFAACSTRKIVRTTNGMVSRLGQTEIGNPILNARTLAGR